jgi:hypothetical protein
MKSRMDGASRQVTKCCPFRVKQ